MFLLIIGIYALVNKRLRILRHYGLAGKGACWVGAVCIALSIGFFSVLGTPIIVLSIILNLGVYGPGIVSFCSQMILLAVVMILMVQKFGNHYAKRTAVTIS